VARSPSPITSTGLERQVVRLHRLSSATGKPAFDVAQRNSALGQGTTDEGETAGRSASLKYVRHRRPAENSLATRDNSTRLCARTVSHQIRKQLSQGSQSRLSSSKATWVEPKFHADVDYRGLASSGPDPPKASRRKGHERSLSTHLAVSVSIG